MGLIGFEQCTAMMENSLKTTYKDKVNSIKKIRVL